MEYLHSQAIIHRDLKVDNLLYFSGTDQVKVCDFSISLKLDPKDEEKLYSCDGNVYFTAPESFFTLNKGFLGRPTDVWTLGISLYLYVSEKFPFVGESEFEIELAAKDKKVIYPKEFSQSLVNLLEKMLCKDPSKRPIASELLVEPWFQGKIS